MVNKLTKDSLAKVEIDAKYNLEDEHSSITLTKILCFCFYPQRYEPNFDILIYDDRNSDTNLVSKIDGNIIHMLKESLLFLKEYLGMSLYINKDKKLERKEAYPIVVLKEVIYNALVHRDYSYVGTSDSIEIHINDDSLVITNPACYLYEGYLDQNSIKITRNKSIKKINNLILDTPKKEKGIKSILLNIKNYGYIQPEFYYECGLFKTTLYNKTIYDFYDKVSIHQICEFCITPRTREEIYSYFNPNGKSSPYYFINKYIIPLIEQNILCYTNTLHKESKKQRIYTNTKL